MTIVFTHPAATGHVTPPGHPERVGRIEAVMDTLKSDAFATGLDWREAPRADRDDLLRAHPEDYVIAVEEAMPEGDGWVSLDGDTHAMAGTWEAALRAAGACTAAVDAVLAGQAKTAFAAMRPPGHHAEKDTAMGFCLFSSVALAAKRALDVHGLGRVAVLDFDVHHGNGTQDVLWDEPRALFVSSHQMPLYPGSGYASEAGASGNVVNLPLDPGTARPSFEQAWVEHAFPAIEAFKPDLILVSAGFDAHQADPLAQCRLTEADFAWITRAICDLADQVCGGRVVSTLEGGYDLEALAGSVAAHVDVLREAEGG